MSTGLGAHVGVAARLRAVAAQKGTSIARRPGTALLIAGALILPVVQGSGFYLQQFQIVALYAMVAVGLNLNLYAGELVVGQSAIFGAGAYTAAVLLEYYPKTDGLLVILASVATSVTVGVLIGIPGLRVGRWYLAMMSFFMITVLQDLLGQWQSVTGGFAGLAGLPSLTVLGHTVDDPLMLYFVCVGVLAITILLTRNLLTSSWGVALSTLRRSDIAAESVGISRYRTKLVVYTLSAIPCGVAGALFVFSEQLVLPDIFSINLTVLFLAAVVLGGERTLFGPVIGMAVLQAIPIYSVDLEAWAPLIYGAFLVIITVLVPGGIVGTLQRLWLYVPLTRLSERKPARAAAPPAAEPMPRPAAAMAVEPLMSPTNAATAEDGSRTLTVRGLTKSFRGLRALDSVDLTAEPGAVTALIGANGSGKTTLLNIVSGFYRADAGTVALGDTNLLGLTPYRIARRGVARTFQTPLIPEASTVLEAVTAAFHWRRGVTILEHVLLLPRSRRERRVWRSQALQLLDQVGIGELAARRAKDLSLGHRRLVELARALALHPHVVLLDEPASGLSETELGRFRSVIGRLRATGIVIVLVEHNLKLVLELADTIAVLDHGRLIASGTPDEVRVHPDVVRSYLGDSSEYGAVRTASTNGHRDAGTAQMPTEAQSISVSLAAVPVLYDVSTSVAPSTLAVVLGPNGAGKTTLLRTLSGLVPSRSGRVRMSGTDVTGWRPNRIARHGVQHVQEGKRIFRRLSVQDNLALGRYRMRADPEVLERLFAMFPVLEAKRSLPAGSLSGGEQQMLAIAQALMSEPSVLLLDEPSAGLAPLLVHRTFQVMADLRAQGLTILLVEQIVRQSLAVADTASILVSGRIVLAGDAHELSVRDDLQELYFGDVSRAASGDAPARLQHDTSGGIQ